MSVAMFAPRSLRFAAPQAGFTLLETIVALVIFTSAVMALYGLFNTNLITLTRVQDISRQAPAVHHAIERLSALNLRGEAAGEFVFDEFDILWSARLVEPYRQGQNVQGYLGYFQLGLYQVDFEVRERERSLGTYQMRLVGYEKVREPSF